MKIALFLLFKVLEIGGFGIKYLVSVIVKAKINGVFGFQGWHVHRLLY